MPCCDTTYTFLHAVSHSLKAQSFDAVVPNSDTEHSQIKRK